MSEVGDYIPTPFDRGLVVIEEGQGCPECFDIDLAYDERWVCEDCETVWAGTTVQEEKK